MNLFCSSTSIVFWYLSFCRNFQKSFQENESDQELLSKGVLILIPDFSSEERLPNFPN